MTNLAVKSVSRHHAECLDSHLSGNWSHKNLTIFWKPSTIKWLKMFCRFYESKHHAECYSSVIGLIKNLATPS